MKIGVNARMLAQPYTGIGQYTKNLFIELAKIDPSVEYLLVTAKKVKKDILNDFPSNVEVKVVREKRFGVAGFSKVWWEQMQIPRVFDREGIDIAFFTYASNPWGKSWYKKGIKSIVTLHDCIPWTEKEYQLKKMSRFYHSKTLKAVKLADQVFTVSKNSKKDIRKICGVEKDRIKVFYNDADSDFKKILDEGFMDNILKKYELKKGRFFLYCGGFDKRKNVHLLVKEYLQYCDKQGDNAIPLVLAGGKLYENYLYEDVEIPKKYQDKIVETGFVEADVLAALYRTCAAFVHLSRKEGFNIPIVEASNCGAPLLLSDIEIHREIAGKNALFVDIQKGNIAESLEKILELDNQKKYAEKSKKIKENYSWKKTAQKVFTSLFKVTNIKL
ncbi:glycosyltransferase family 4 protein [Patescibacteria group bacterium]